jgi:hypothetical protein
MGGIIATLTFELQDDGNVRVGGPISDKILCYGIIERGKDAIRSFNPAAASGIVGASMVPPNLTGKL